MLEVHFLLHVHLVVPNFVNTAEREVFVVAIFEGLFQPTHLLVLGIITVFLLGRRLLEIARILGKHIAEFRNAYRRLLSFIQNSLRKPQNHRKDWDAEEPGASMARLDPPDKPRPPAQVALTPPKSEED